MGAANAIAAYRLYAGKVPWKSMSVLAYMALVALDKDAVPKFWQGHEAIAVHCLGRPEPVSKSDLRAVESAITPLYKAGAITTDRHSSGRGDTRITARYRLWLAWPAPDEKRRPQHRSTRRFVVEHPTLSGHAPDEKRRAKEDEEDEERSYQGLGSHPHQVEGSPAAPSQDHIENGSQAAGARAARSAS